MQAQVAATGARVDESVQPITRVQPQPVWISIALRLAADVLVIWLSMFLAYQLRSSLPGAGGHRVGARTLLLGTYSLPLWVTVFVRYRLYNSRFIRSRLDEFQNLMHAVAASVLGMAVIGFMAQWYVYRGWLVLTFGITAGLVSIERECVRRAVIAGRRRGHFLRKAVIIGGNAEGMAICGALMKDPGLGYEVVGFIDQLAKVGDYVYDHRPVLAHLDTAVQAVQASGAESAIIATTAVDFETSNGLTRRLTEAGIHVELSSTLQDIAAERVSVHPLGRFPVMYVEPVRRHGWRSAAKRFFDISVASFLLILGAIPMALVAIAIKLDSRGPAFFRQSRVGRDGRLFDVVKFRTMVVDAEKLRAGLDAHNEADGALFKIKEDPRVTRVGKLLRRFSIDELPQLWNVVRGEMSLVGPRPLPTTDVQAYQGDLQGRLRVRPGITGMWQVNGRSMTTFDEFTRLDLYYVDNWSLLADLAILAKTLPAVFFRRGAY